MDFRSIVILILSIILTLTFISYIIQAKKQEKIKEINKENLIKLKLEEQSILERAQEEKAQLEKETQKYQSMLDDIQHNYELEKKRLDSEIIQKTIQVNKLKSDFDAKKQSLEELYEGLKSQKEEKLNEYIEKRSAETVINMLTSLNVIASNYHKKNDELINYVKSRQVIVFCNYLKELELQDSEGTQNRFIRKVNDKLPIKFTYKFQDPQLRHQFIVLPVEYPDLVSLTTSTQRFGIEAFDIIDQIPLHIDGLENDIIFKIYVYRQALSNLDQEVTYNFE